MANDTEEGERENKSISKERWRVQEVRSWNRKIGCADLKKMSGGVGQTQEGIENSL
jgi:hypothetical protein